MWVSGILQFIVDHILGFGPVGYTLLYIEIQIKRRTRIFKHKEILAPVQIKSPATTDMKTSIFTGVLRQEAFKYGILKSRFNELDGLTLFQSVSVLV